MRWPFERYRKVIKILHDAYFAQVEQDERARKMLPSGWQDVLDIIDKDAWTNSGLYIKQGCFKLVDEVIQSIERWPKNKGAPGVAFNCLASKVAYYIDQRYLCVSCVGLILSDSAIDFFD